MRIKKIFMTETLDKVVDIASIAIVIFAAVFAIVSMIIGHVRYKEGIAIAEEMVNSIGVYLTTATDEEYEEIAEKLRHDMVRNRFDKDSKEIIDLIPNTSDRCALEVSHSQPYLLYLNTGESYPLGPLDEDTNDGEPNSEEHGYMRMSFGHDEVSGSRHDCRAFPDGQYTDVTFYRKSGTVSVQRVKEAFCDDCIDKLLEAVSDKLVAEAVLVDPISGSIYNISDDHSYEMGDYTVSIAEEESGCYQFYIEYSAQN